MNENTFLLATKLSLIRYGDTIFYRRTGQDQLSVALVVGWRTTPGGPPQALVHGGRGPDGLVSLSSIVERYRPGAGAKTVRFEEAS